VADELTDAYRRSVEEGTTRLRRSWPQLLATGAVGGLDVSIGVFAMFVVHEKTGSEVLGAVAFTIGFVALTLASSELFTENFLVPVTAVVAKDASVWDLLRLWVGTTVTNFAGGWVAMALVVAGFPELKAVALEVGSHPPTLGIGTVAFCSAVIGGGAITLMTWMERSTESVPAKLVSAIGIGFLLAAAPLQHAIVISIEMFAALRTGVAPFGYLDWLGTMGWAVVGNLVGGLGLVTALRLVQVGAKEIEQTQEEDH
jgi:formate/nitrite transporter FocA (FNT family)